MELKERVAALEEGLREVQLAIAELRGRGRDAGPRGYPKREKDAVLAIKKWKCGDYIEVLDPSGNPPSVPRKWRICGDWSDCPSICTTGDGAQWQFQGNCADEP